MDRCSLFSRSLLCETSDLLRRWTLKFIRLSLNLLQLSMPAYIINLSVVPLLPVPPLVHETSLQLTLSVVHELPLRNIPVVESVRSLFPQHRAVCDGHAPLETILVVVVYCGCQILKISVVLVEFAEISSETVVARLDRSFSFDLVKLEVAFVSHVPPGINSVPMLLAVQNLSSVFADFNSVGVEIGDFALQQLIMLPDALVDGGEVIFCLFQLSRPMPDVSLPVADVLPAWKSEFSLPTFFVLEPAALVVDLLVIIEVNALIGLLALTPIALIDDFPIDIIDHPDQFSNAAELSVVELSQIDDAVDVIQRLEDVDAHIVHVVLLPEPDVSITIIENVNTVSVLDVAVTLTVTVAVQVHEPVLLFHFQIQLRKNLHRSFMWRKESSSSVKTMWVYWASYWLILRMLCSCLRLLMSSLCRNYFCPRLVRLMRYQPKYIIKNIALLNHLTFSTVIRPY